MMKRSAETKFQSLNGGFVYRRLNRTPRRSRCSRISIINPISTLRAAREFRSRFRARAKTTTVNLDAPHCMKKFFFQEQRRALRLTRRQYANACFPINFTSTSDFKAAINYRIDGYRASGLANGLGDVRARIRAASS